MTFFPKSKLSLGISPTYIMDPKLIGEFRPYVDPKDFTIFEYIDCDPPRKGKASPGMVTLRQDLDECLMLMVTIEANKCSKFIVQRVMKYLFKGMPKHQANALKDRVVINYLGAVIDKNAYEESLLRAMVNTDLDYGRPLHED